MKDNFGREIEYLRISVTDRCNLRCRYCMPSEGIENIPHSEILSYSEIVFLAKIFSGLGIKKIKITGGEPLVRKGIESLVSELKNVSGIEEVTLTTNGVLLSDKIEGLISSGLDSVNISLDTLNRDKYIKLTGFDELDRVMSGLDKCLSLGIKTKLNVVTLRDFNFDEIVPLAGFAKERNMDVRFIELMPIGLGKNHPSYIEDEIMAILNSTFGEGKRVDYSSNGPSVYYSFPEFKGHIGFISPLSNRFCESCNRIRLTSTGILKPCLESDMGIDLKSLLRNGQEGQLWGIIKGSVLAKPKAGILNGIDIKPMNQIGG